MDDTLALAEAMALATALLTSSEWVAADAAVLPAVAWATASAMAIAVTYAVAQAWLEAPAEAIPAPAMNIPQGAYVPEPHVQTWPLVTS